MSHASVRETEEHEPLAKALELGRLSDRGELGPALQKMPIANVRLGLKAEMISLRRPVSRRVNRTGNSDHPKLIAEVTRARI
jgi:hypothetical protein